MFSLPHCNQSSGSVGNGNVERKPEATIKRKEYSYFLTRNLSKTRYIFVDSNRYGIMWSNVLFITFLHICYFAGIVRVFVDGVYGLWIFGSIYGFLAGVGITVGSHRLWAHKSYKAKLPLRIALAIMQTIAGQLDVYGWVQIHRLHHKFSDTDADPHNSKRGFFFAHIGWVMTKEHPDVHLKQETIDFSDLLKDPVVRFQKKYYTLLYTFFCFLLPALVCHYLLGGSWIDSFVIGSFGRYIIFTHVAFFVNSAAHMFGDRPYNSNLAPRENPYVSVVTWGSEGFHNYHHVFPWDYTISEMGWKFNPMKSFIEIMAKCGQAYDLRRPTKEIIQKTKENAKRRFAPIDAYETPHIYY